MMEKALFRKKYLGEVTLKNGEHVKFLFPIVESNLDWAKLEAQSVWRQIHKPKAKICEYEWAFIDDLDLSQFQIVYVGTKVYGNNYWKLVWENYLEKNKKSS